jgi:hypothetical protein
LFLRVLTVSIIAIHLAIAPCLAKLGEHYTWKQPAATILYTLSFPPRPIFCFPICPNPFLSGKVLHRTPLTFRIWTLHW